MPSALSVYGEIDLSICLPLWHCAAAEGRILAEITAEIHSIQCSSRCGDIERRLVRECLYTNNDAISGIMVLVNVQ